jgi:hypothetical protein
VDELISPINGTWDEDLIWSIFLPVDAEKILMIPLSSHLTDEILSHGTRRRTISLVFGLHTIQNGIISLVRRLEEVMDRELQGLMRSGKILGDLKVPG